MSKIFFSLLRHFDTYLKLNTCTGKNACACDCICTGKDIDACTAKNIDAFSGQIFGISVIASETFQSYL